MLYLGKIDLAIYQCISMDMTNEYVVLSDAQEAHMRSRHPLEFDLLLQFLSEILSEPDFILEDEKHPNTGVVLKHITRDGNHFQVILRLQTTKDPEGYSNSVISAWKISESRWNNYLRNKKILYKRI